EDGIRDRNVTGVQTCALPIFFLVALGIDYNIILISRFIEERKMHRVKDALEIAIRNTGGVISSAGVILAATFAALTTMPIADLRSEERRVGKECRTRRCAS